MKEMHVFGMDLADYPVKEAMRKVDEYLVDAKVNTVSFLSMDVLMAAGEDEELRTYLSGIDLTVPISVEILNSAGIAGRSRLKEVEEGKFYKELMRKVSDDKRTAFLLTEKEETIEPFTEYLKKSAPGIIISGHYAFENLSGDPDAIVNEINSTFSDIVFSRLSSPKQEKFIYENSSKLNVKLWVALKENFKANEPKTEGGFKRLRNKIHAAIFRLRLNKFKDEDNKDDNDKEN